MKRPKSNTGAVFAGKRAKGHLIHKGRPQTQSIATNSRVRRTADHSNRYDCMRELQMNQVSSAATLQRHHFKNEDLFKGSIAVA